MNGRVRIVNDPIDIVPLLVTFKNSEYKKIYEMLNKSWCTEEELKDQLEQAVEQFNGEAG